jgi:hypothetical protein
MTTYNQAHPYARLDLKKAAGTERCVAAEPTGKEG